MIEILNDKVVIRHILLIETERTHGTLINATSIFRSLSHISVAHLMITGIVHIHTKTRTQRKPLYRSQFGKPVRVERIPLISFLIISQVTHRIGNGHEGTVGRSSHSVTVIIHLTPVQHHNLLVCTAHIHRINRSDVVGHIERIARRSC